MTHPLTEAIARALCIADGEPVDACAKFYAAPATAAIEAIKAAGFAIVPREPSEAMTIAGIIERHDQPTPEAWNLATANIYRAMIKAAEGERG